MTQSRLVIVLALTIGCSGANHEPSTPDDDLGVGTRYPPRPVWPGSIDPDVVDRAIDKRKRAEIQECFDREFFRSKPLVGTVKTLFLIDTDGSVSYVSAVGVNKYVDACVAAVIQRTRFPEPTGGAVQVTRDFYGISDDPNSPRDLDSD